MAYYVNCYDINLGNYRGNTHGLCSKYVLCILFFGKGVCMLTVTTKVAFCHHSGCRHNLVTDHATFSQRVVVLF